MKVVVRGPRTDRVKEAATREVDDAEATGMVVRFGVSGGEKEGMEEGFDSHWALRLTRMIPFL